MDVASSEGSPLPVHAVVNEERVYMLINQLKRASKRLSSLMAIQRMTRWIKMKIFPAVDILGGRCVQPGAGKTGERDSVRDPLSCAMRWLDEGCNCPSMS